MTGGLRVPVALLRRRDAAPRVVRATAVLDGLRIGNVGVDGDEVVLDFEVGASGTDIVASGTVDVDWTGECRRCLEPVNGHLRAEVREVFRAEDPRRSGEGDAGDTYPLESDAGELLVDLGVSPATPYSWPCRFHRCAARTAPGRIPSASRPYRKRSKSPGTVLSNRSGIRAGRRSTSCANRATMADRPVPVRPSAR